MMGIEGDIFDEKMLEGRKVGEGGDVCDSLIEVSSSILSVNSSGRLDVGMPAVVKKGETVEKMGQ